MISDWFTNERGEPCAEPSEGGSLQPLTAESIIARWVSMIIEMSSVRRWNPKPRRRWSAAIVEGGRRGVRGHHFRDIVSSMRV